MYKIKFKDVSFSYNEESPLSVDGVNFGIQKGEFIAVLGHNGSGKSTIAKLMNALLVSTKGEVQIDELNSKNDDDIWNIRQRVGMVFQNPDNQMVATTVEEEIAFGPENIGLEKEVIKERIDFSIERVDMQEFLNRAPHKLSGGQKQRIAIAGVLAMLPSCIIFDEPTSMLDPIGRSEVLDTITKLKNDGITTILITHFMNEAMLADRIMVMNDGKLVMKGAPSEIFTRVDKLKEYSLEMPENIYIANKLKESGLNIELKMRSREELVAELCLLKSKI